MMFRRCATYHEVSMAKVKRFIRCGNRQGAIWRGLRDVALENGRHDRDDMSIGEQVKG